MPTIIRTTTTRTTTRPLQPRRVLRHRMSIMSEGIRRLLLEEVIVVTPPPPSFRPTTLKTSSTMITTSIIMGGRVSASQAPRQLILQQKNYGRSRPAEHMLTPTKVAPTQWRRKALGVPSRRLSRLRHYRHRHFVPWLVTALPHP